MSLFRKSERAAPRQSPSVQAIDVVDVYPLVKKGTVTLIDVRQSDEWADTGRPASSHGITLQDNDFLDQLSQLVEGNKAAAIAFICKGGGRSTQAAKRANNAGYTDVYNVVGGYQAWTGANLP